MKNKVKLRSITCNFRTADPDGKNTRVIGEILLDSFSPVYDSFSGKWREKFDVNAFSRTLKESNIDIVSYFNHDQNYILGRASANTLNITLDKKAKKLVFEIDIPESRRDVYESIKRGDVKGNSFMFVDKEVKYEDDVVNGSAIRNHIIMDADLYEVGPVVEPFYPQSKMGLARSMGFNGVEQPELYTGSIGKESREMKAEIQKLLEDNPDILADDIVSAIKELRPDATDEEIHDMIQEVKSELEDDQQEERSKETIEVAEVVENDIETPEEVETIEVAEVVENDIETPEEVETIEEVEATEEVNNLETTEEVEAEEVAEVVENDIETPEEVVNNVEATENVEEHVIEEKKKEKRTYDDFNKNKNKLKLRGEDEQMGNIKLREKAVLKKLRGKKLNTNEQKAYMAAHNDFIDSLSAREREGFEEVLGVRLHKRGLDGSTDDNGKIVQPLETINRVVGESAFTPGFLSYATREALRGIEDVKLPIMQADQAAISYKDYGAVANEINNTTFKCPFEAKRLPVTYDAFLRLNVHAPLSRSQQVIALNKIQRKWSNEYYINLLAHKAVTLAGLGVANYNGGITLDAITETATIGTLTLDDVVGLVDKLPEEYRDQKGNMIMQMGPNTLSTIHSLNNYATEQYAIELRNGITFISGIEVDASDSYVDDVVQAGDVVIVISLKSNSVVYGGQVVSDSDKDIKKETTTESLTTYGEAKMAAPLPEFGTSALEIRTA